MSFVQLNTPSMATHQSPLPCPLDRSLRFYIVRSDHTMVPLVPADQLPFQIQGISRRLNHQQMSEDGWKFHIQTTEPALPLSIQAPARTLPSSPKFLPPDYQARNRATSMLGSIGKGGRLQPAVWTSPTLTKPVIEDPLTHRAHSAPANRTSTVSSFDRRHSTFTPTPDNAESLSDTIAKVYQQDAKRFNYIEPGLNKREKDKDKEYCSYWIRTGECAFLAQGCLYKHEMPPLEKLRAIGFNSVPRWYRDKTAVRSLTWMQQRMNQEKEGLEQTAEAPKMRVFDISSIGKHTTGHSDTNIGTLGKLKTELDHGVLSKENEQDLVRGLISYSKKQTPNLIDIDVDVPAPPPSPEPSSSSTAFDTDSADDSSSSISPNSPPPPPHLDQMEMDKLAEGFSRYVRRPSNASSSASDVQIHKQYPKRNPTPKKTPKSAPLPVGSKKPGLAKSKYAAKGSEAATIRKADTEKKATLQSPGLQAQITKVERHASGREGRHRATVAQPRGASVN